MAASAHPWDYRERRPCGALAPFVECFWSLVGDPRAASDAPEPILPDGRVEWVIHLGDPVLELLPGGALHTQPQRLVVGQLERVTVIAPSGTLRCLGIRFKPAGAPPVLRVPMDSLAGRIVAADAVDAGLDRALAERMDPEGNPADWMRVAEQVLLARGIGGATPDPVVEASATALVRTHGRTRIGDLAGELGISRRTLERRFAREVGLPPKRFARLLRFQRIFRELGGGQTDWAKLAVGSGYFDQSHLIRDFNQFAGVTPARLAWDESSLTRSFAGEGGVSHLSNASSR